MEESCDLKREKHHIGCTDIGSVVTFHLPVLSNATHWENSLSSYFTQSYGTNNQHVNHTLKEKNVDIYFKQDQIISSFLSSDFQNKQRGFKVKKIVCSQCLLVYQNDNELVSVRL